jgi:microcompartment protein CcmK/EutM
MKIGFVAGTLWNGRQHRDLNGAKLLVVRYVDRRLAPIDDYAVCADAVGAGVGEWVLTVAGSSARMTERTRHLATDRAIVGIIDQIDMDGVAAGSDQ